MTRVSEKTIRERVAAIGGDLDIGWEGQSYSVGAYTPAGLAWEDTGCHTLIECWYTDPAGCRHAALDRMNLGTRICDNPDCDVCQEGRMTSPLLSFPRLP